MQGLRVRRAVSSEGGWRAAAAVTIVDQVPSPCQVPAGTALHLLCVIESPGLQPVGQWFAKTTQLVLLECEPDRKLVEGSGTLLRSAAASGAVHELVPTSKPSTWFIHL